MKSIRFDLAEKLDAVIRAAEAAGLGTNPPALAAIFLRDYFRTFQPTDTHASRSLVARKLKEISEPEDLMLQLQERGLLPAEHAAAIRHAVLLLTDNEAEEKLFSAIKPFINMARQCLWSNRFAETLDRMFSAWNDGRWRECDTPVKLSVLDELDMHLNQGFGPNEWSAPSTWAAELIALLPKGKTAEKELNATLGSLLTDIQIECRKADQLDPMDTWVQLPELQLPSLSRLSRDEMDQFRPLDQRLLQAVAAFDADEVKQIDDYMSLRNWGKFLPEMKFYQLRYVAAYLQKQELKSIKGGAELAQAVGHCLEFLSVALSRFSPVPGSY